MSPVDIAARRIARWLLAALGAVMVACAPAPNLALAAEEAPATAPAPGDVHMKDFRFASGETLPDLRLHYWTLGVPKRDAGGHVTNAVVLLHGTGGDGLSFLRPQFSGELFGPGQPLDTRSHYIIMIDAIGHGGSSKPSNGLHMRFPAYDYADMVTAAHRLVTEHLAVQRIRLLFGTSMGCMHAFVWAETYPDDVAAVMPMACLPAPIAGRNRIWRSMVISAIRHDPDWKGGEYDREPVAGLRVAADLLFIAGSAPHQDQKTWPTRAAADAFVAAGEAALPGKVDANDLIYQLDASRTYDPTAGLGRITAPLLWINSADDFINPPSLGIAEALAPRIATGRFVLLPISERTHGHGTHTWATAWKDLMVDFLQRTEPAH